MDQRFCAYCGHRIPEDRAEESTCCTSCTQDLRAFCLSVAQRAYRAVRYRPLGRRVRPRPADQVQERRAFETCLCAAVGGQAVPSPRQCLRRVGVTLAKSYLWQLASSAKLCDVRRLWLDFAVARSRV